MNTAPPILEKYHRQLRNLKWAHWHGKVQKVDSLTLECTGLTPVLGELCQILPKEKSQPPILGEVIGIREQTCILMPLEHPEGIAYGSEVIPLERRLTVCVGDFLLGRVLDGFGRPLDNGMPLPAGLELPIVGDRPLPLLRPAITEPLPTGVRVIDGLLTCGRGQKIGIFSGSGVGKSTLLGAIARHATIDVAVVALIGERGREVKEFVEEILGPPGLQRAVVVAATSDTSPIQRVTAAMTAMTMAEYFRHRGRHVLFFCDSVTRLALALREIKLALHEPPTLRGYPASLFSILSQFVERAGNSLSGSITGIYTVLVEGDDLNEPVADTLRSILDGHIVLSRELAHDGHFPAVDILSSVSRLMPRLASPSHLCAAQKFRHLYATYQNALDLIRIGAYKSGSDPEVDRAIAKIQGMNAWLRQELHQAMPCPTTIEHLQQLMGE